MQDRLEQLATSCTTTEKHLAKLQGGYQMRNKTLRQKMIDAHDALERARIDLDTKRIVSVGEEAAVMSRLEKLREEVESVSRRERWAQDLYRERKEELDALS